MGCVKFLHEEEKFLIEQYKGHRYLWDMKDEQYFDKRVRNEALRNIAGLFNEVYGKIVTEEDIKKKWKNLRSTFGRELKKTLNSLTESENAETYRSKWLHFKDLQFLKDEALTEMGLISVVEGMDCSDMENSVSAFKEDCNLTSSSVLSRTPDRSKYVSPTILQLTSAKVPSTTLKNTRQTDSIDDFLSYVGKSLRKLPEFNVQRCILKMQNALFEEFEAVENSQ